MLPETGFGNVLVKTLSLEHLLGSITAFSRPAVSHTCSQICIIDMTLSVP